jgi:hypothetical protein
MELNGGMNVTDALPDDEAPQGEFLADTDGGRESGPDDDWDDDAEHADY